MYAITTSEAGITLTVGTGPIMDLATVIELLHEGNVVALRVVPATDEYQERAAKIDKMLYTIGFDVA